MQKLLFEIYLLLVTVPLILVEETASFPKLATFSTATKSDLLIRFF